MEAKSAKPRRVRPRANLQNHQILAMASKLSLDATYVSKNRECAEIILANIHRYCSKKSLMVRWARLVLHPPSEPLRRRVA